jgi:hypothetical protein
MSESILTARGDYFGMTDTGIGREAGFESDKALHDAVEAEIAAFPEPAQRVIREANRRIERMSGPDK